MLPCCIGREMEPSSIESVCRYIHEHLRLDDTVQARFRAQNVDAHVVCSCSGAELETLGVTTLGHQKKLLSFCTSAIKRQKEQDYLGGIPSWLKQASPPMLKPSPPNPYLHRSPRQQDRARGVSPDYMDQVIARAGSEAYTASSFSRVGGDRGGQEARTTPAPPPPGRPPAGMMTF
jgi:hypothetical protein